MRYLGENPELYAREILASFQLRPPIDIYFLCKLFNIEIFFDDLKNVEAFFILKNGKKKIVANNSIMYEKRLKFTISHEIGHYILPWHKNIIYDCKTKDIINFNSYNVFCKPKFLTFAKLFPQAPVGNFYVNPNSFD